jgi:hypothetical protein
MGFAASCLVFFGVTYPLWLGTSNFPQIPFVHLLSGAPPWVSCGCLLTAVTALLALFYCGVIEWRRSPDAEASEQWLRQLRVALLVFLGTVGLSVLLNQHRLQPWTYHFLIVAALLWPRRGESSRAASVRLQSHLTLLTASIYGWSAWSKLDATFLQTYGQQFVDAILGTVQLSTRFWSPSARLAAAAVLPIGELVVAALLVSRRTRVAGCALSWFMHLGLILAVGPWGLNHLHGVLLWNAYFILQNALLGVCSWRTASLKPSSSSSDVHQATRGWQSRLVLVVAILPLLHSWNWLDDWAAWAVYASGTAKVTIAIQESAIVRLPAELRPYLETQKLQTGWRFLRVERWSLDATRAPIYPQDRFFIGVALAISQRCNLDHELRVIWQSPANRWTGQRTTIDLSDRANVIDFAQTFGLNALP